MDKLKNQWRNYVAKKSKIGIAFDIFFIIVFIAMVIPTSRKVIKSAIYKSISFAPSQLEEKTALSKIDYAWSVEDLFGETVHIDSLKKEILFVNFWATWCPPCIAEMSSIQELYNKYGNDVQFLLISNEKSEVLHNFIEENGYTFPIYRLKGDIPPLFRSKSIPYSLLISGEGELRIRKEGAADWNSNSVHQLLDSLLSN